VADGDSSQSPHNTQGRRERWLRRQLQQPSGVFTGERMASNLIRERGFKGRGASIRVLRKVSPTSQKVNLWRKRLK